jgi:non-specific protein-tyrosine kinase
VELNELIGPLRKWWWLLILSTAVAVLTTYLVLAQQPPSYEAQATLMIGHLVNSTNPNSNDIALSQQLANSYADIAMRRPVRTATMASLGLDWLPGYSVRSKPDTNLLEITVYDVDPQRARAVANELAQQLILQTPTNGNTEASKRRAFLHSQLDELEAKIKDSEDELNKAQEALANQLSAREIADTQSQIAALQTKLATLQGNYAVLLSNTDQGAINTLTLIEPADLPEGPVSSGNRRTIMLVAAVGFLLSAGAAYLLSYLDDTIKSPGDVKRALGMSTLGAVPVMEKAGSELVMLPGHHSTASEAYRMLRTNLQFAAVEQPLRRLLVTSPAPTEGKSLSAANLAMAMAQAGQRVIIVDTDLHRPRLHRLFGLANNAGLTTALLEDKPVIEPLLQATDQAGLWVLTSGAIPPNPTEMLASARMRELLSELSGIADTIILDSPPAVILADAAVLATQCDGVLLVVDAGGTRRDMALRAVEALRSVNARILGVLLNRVAVRGGYYYYYGKSYGMTEEPHGGKGGGTWGGIQRLNLRLGRRPAAPPTSDSSQQA